MPPLPPYLHVTAWEGPNDGQTVVWVLDVILFCFLIYQLTNSCFLVTMRTPQVHSHRRQPKITATTTTTTMLLEPTYVIKTTITITTKSTTTRRINAPTRLNNTETVVAAGARNVLRLKPLGTFFFSLFFFSLTKYTYRSYVPPLPPYHHITAWKGPNDRFSIIWALM